jgi:DNA-binding transcriptional LysR family regulator
MTQRSRAGDLLSRPGSQSGLELRHLRAFVALADYGRTTTAAHALGLAQSTVSESLLALERTLGATVFLRPRGGRRGGLTDVGRALLPHARKALAAVDAAHAAVAAATRTARASFRIIANESVSTYMLPTAIAQVRDRWAGVRFSVEVAACADVQAGIVDGSFDVGLMLAGGRASAAASDAARSAPNSLRRTLGSAIPLLAFTARAHPLLKRGAVARPSALADYPVVVSDAAGDFHDLVGRFIRDDRRRPVLESAGSVEGVKRSVQRRSNAIGFLPAYAIVEELRAGDIAALDIRPAPPMLRLDALLSTSRVRHPAMDDLLRALDRGRIGS